MRSSLSIRGIHCAEKSLIGLSPGKSLAGRKHKVRHVANASLKSVSGGTVDFCPVKSCVQSLEYFVAIHPHFCTYLGKHFRITDIPRLREVSPQDCLVIGIIQAFGFREQTDFVGTTGVWHKSRTVERKISRLRCLTDGTFCSFQPIRRQDRGQRDTACGNIRAQQVGVPMQANRTLFCQPGQSIQADITPGTNKVCVDLNGRGALKTPVIASWEALFVAIMALLLTENNFMSYKQFILLRRAMSQCKY